MFIIRRMVRPNYAGVLYSVLIATALLRSWGGPYVGWMRWRIFSICCYKPLKQKYRLMKAGRLMVVGEAFVTSTQLCHWRRKAVSHVLLYSVKVQNATEDVNTRTHTLRDKVSSAHTFFQARNKWVVPRAHYNPLCARWHPFQPARNPPPLKGIVCLTELPQTMNTISRNSYQ